MLFIYIHRDPHTQFRADVRCDGQGYHGIWY